MRKVIVITARLKSVRLPMKVIKPLMGRPMISHMLDRLKLIDGVQHIVICTSYLAQDDPLEEIARQEGVECHRGHPDDVLQRLCDGAGRFGADVVIHTAADSPLVEASYVEAMVDHHLVTGNDLTITTGLPIGTYAYASRYPALALACEIKDTTDTEFWGGYFVETGLFQVGRFNVSDPAVSRPDLRLTVDTPEDFELMSRIFEALYREGETFTLADTVAFCDANPQLIGMNSKVEQSVPRPIKLKQTVGSSQLAVGGGR